MVIKEVSLETVCGITSKLPDNQLPEVAFAGKSNVGKSSLINALMNRKSLARTSSQPGKTQTINFFNVNNAMYFVDLPGYGYAKANVKVKEQWGKMVERYLHKSRQLRQVFHLIDIRHALGERPHDVRLDFAQWLSSDHHRYEAGQDQTEPDTKAIESDPQHPGGGEGDGHHPFFGRDQAGA